MDREEKQLLHELKSFRKQLDEHDSLTRTRESLFQFLKKEDQEININIKSGVCVGEIKVTINNKEYSNHELRGFDLHEIVRTAVINHSK